MTAGKARRRSVRRADIASRRNERGQDLFGYSTANALTGNAGKCIKAYVRPDSKNLGMRTFRIPAADERKYLLYKMVFVPAATSRYSIPPQT